MHAIIVVQSLQQATALDNLGKEKAMKVFSQLVDNLKAIPIYTLGLIAIIVIGLGLMLLYISMRSR